MIPRILRCAVLALLVVAAGAGSLRAQPSPEVVDSPPGSRAAGDALRLLGPGDGTPLDDLRRGFLLAVHAPETLATAVGALQAVEAERGGARAPEPLLRAYRGALDVLRARDARWPPTRWGHLERGMGGLDSAVETDPWSAEVRALRLMTEMHLPGMFRREEVIRADEAFLLHALEVSGHDLTPGMERIVRGLLESR